MAYDREQREKFVELIGDGTDRRIRLTVVSVLALSGLVLQGLVLWYAVRMAREEWDAVGPQVWAFTVGIWVLTVCLLLTLLWKRLKGPPEGRVLEG